MQTFTAPRRPLSQRAALWCSATRYRAHSHMQRYRMAWRYLSRQLTEEDARDLIWDCQSRAGYQILETLTVDSVIEQARERWEDFPELEQLCADAVARVGSKWSSSGHIASAAEEWAMDLIPEYAEMDGIVLSEIDA